MEFDVAEVNKIVNIYETGKICLVNVYVVLILGAAVLVYFSFQKEWYLVKSSLGAVLAVLINQYFALFYLRQCLWAAFLKKQKTKKLLKTINKIKNNSKIKKIIKKHKNLIGDNGPDANGKEFESNSSEQAMMCQDELSWIISMFMSFLIEVIAAANPEFRQVLEKLRSMKDRQGAVIVSLLFNFVARLLLLWPALFAAVLILATSLAHVFTGNLLINATGIVAGITLLTGGMMSMVGFESLVNSIFELIPFITLRVRQTVGWNYGFGAFLLVLTALSCFVVDFFAPPLTPKMPLDFGEQIKAEEKEFEDMMGLHIERCEDIVAKNLIAALKQEEVSFFD